MDSQLIKIYTQVIMKIKKKTLQVKKKLNKLCTVVIIYFKNKKYKDKFVKTKVLLVKMLIK